MAKKALEETDATKAVSFFRNCTGYLDALSKIGVTYRGKVQALRFLKLKKGVSQIVTIRFPDGSGINLTKYIPENGDVVTSIKLEGS